MDPLDQLVQIIGLDALKFLHSLFLMSSDKDEQQKAYSLMRMINKEIAILRGKVDILFKKTVTIGKNTIPTCSTNESATQTDMFSLLHPEGTFVNLHLGEIKQINSNSNNLQEAALAYHKIVKATENSSTSTNDKIFSSEDNTPKRGRKKIILRPYAVNGDKTENQSEDGTSPESVTKPWKPQPQAVVEKPKTTTGEVKSIKDKITVVTSNRIKTADNVMKNNVIKAFAVNKTENKTLKCGQLISIPKCKLTPIPGNAFIKPMTVIPPNGFPGFTRADFLTVKPNLTVANDDTLSTISSVPDPTELDRYLNENDNSSEIAKNLALDIPSEPKSSRKAEDKLKIRMFMEWQLCDVIDNAGYALIHRAVLNNNVARLKVQCLARKSKKLDLNILDSLNRSPLELAILNNSSLEIFETLQSCGVDMTIKQHDTGNSMVHLAVQHTKDLKVYRFIVRYANQVLAHVNEEGYTALHLAVRHNISHMKVNMLLLAPLSERYINIPDRNSGKTALFYAIETNDKKLVEMFFLCKADPNMTTLSGQSLLDVIHDMDVSQGMKDLIQNQVNRSRSNKEETVEDTGNRKRKTVPSIMGTSNVKKKAL